MPSTLPLSQVAPDCGSVRPWAHSRGGARLRPYGRQPAFSSFAKPTTSNVSLQSVGGKIRTTLDDVPGTKSYLFAVVQALVVIFQRGHTLLLAGLTIAGIDHIAAESFLPEGEAAGGTWGETAIVSRKSTGGQEHRGETEPPPPIAGLLREGQTTTRETYRR